MRTEKRLKMLREWTYETVCRGRKMKTPAPGMDFTKIVRQEPNVFLAYAPTRKDETRENEIQLSEGIDPKNVAPGIIIAPVSGEVHYREEKRFDQYNRVNRPPDMGQSLIVQLIFIVYEDGVRLPGFLDEVEQGNEYPMDLVREGSEEGLFTLTNWMDDFKDALLSAKTIPGTDLIINDEMFDYGWYSDQKFIADRRPCFIGIVTAKFQCYAYQFNPTVDKLLR